MGRESSRDRDSAQFLRLEQFLDLESRWHAADSPEVLAHRICASAAMLLDTPNVAIGLDSGAAGYRLIASEGDWPETPGTGSGTADRMAKRALSLDLPQLRGVGDIGIGAFPFRLASGRHGCLHVRIPRPLFSGSEVTFLRFLTSLVANRLSACEPAGDDEASVPKLSLRSDNGTRPHGGDGPVEPGARRYVAMAVHDLRNPLNVVSGYASLLADGAFGELNEEQTEAVQAISRQSALLAGVIDQLLDLDRMGEPGGSTEISAFNLRDLFRELRDRCFPESDDRVEWPGAETAFEFRSDRRRVFSIVQNLVDNALKHAGDGKVTTACTREGGRLIVSVSDRGPGMGSELKALLSGSGLRDCRDVKGAGLGLFAVRCYTRALSGTVEVLDQKGGGTKIVVEIPAYEEDGAAEEKRS
jgi:two-component system sensor histidine kinase KdpD